MHPLPNAALTRHIAILGKSGSGKSNLAKTIAADLLDGGKRVCVLDPTGTWYGMRLDRTGKKPSKYRIPIFGGAHADLEIDRAHGATLAEAISTSSTSAIIDTRSMTVGARTEFFTGFAETLLQKNRGPLHVIVDEAHLFAPQGRVADPKSGAMLHAANNLVSLGRGVGLSVILISQRPAKIHKDSLTQVETLVAMRLIAPQDIGAVKDWIGEWADPAEGKELLRSLPSLPTGDAWVWSPEIGHLKRASGKLAPFFDSGSGRAEDVRLQEIDIDAMANLLESAAAEIKANDPKTLKAELTKLRQQVAAATKSASGPTEPNPRYIAEAEARGRAAGFADAIAQMQASANDWERFVGAWNAAVAEMGQKAAEALAAMRKVEAVARAKSVAPANSSVPPKSASDLKRSAPPPRPPQDGISGPQQRVIDALLMWRGLGNKAPTRPMVAAAAGYKPGTGNFGNILGALRSAGIIDIPAPGSVSLVGMESNASMTKEEARERMLSVLSPPQTKLISAMEANVAKSRDDLAAATGYAPGTGNFGNLIGSLCTLDIFVKPRPGYVALSDWAAEIL